MLIAILENFTDYFSRKVIRYETAAEYYSDVGAGHYELKSGVNFIINDNLNTELVVNNMGIQPNYLLALDDKYSIIQSRWYVLRAERLSGVQWRLTLRRDVIADKYNELLDAPLYVEKGTLPDSDPMILNSEGLQFNKIKVSEELLQDELKCSWLVGYIARSTGSESITSTLPAPTVASTTLSAIAADAGMTEPQLSALLNINGSGNQSQFFNSLCLRYGMKEDRDVFIFPFIACNTYLNTDNFSWLYHTWEGITNFTYPLYNRTTANQPNQVALDLGAYLTLNQSNFRTDLASLLTLQFNYFSEAQLNKLKSHNGEIVLYSGNYYKFSVEEKSTTTLDSGYKDPSGTLALASAISYAGTPLAGGRMRIIAKGVNAEVKLTSSASTVPSLTSTISSGRLSLLDRPYDIFAIPVTDGYMLAKPNGGGWLFYNSSSEFALRLATQIAITLDAKLYDLQLLPYCPLRNAIRYTIDEHGNKQYFINVEAYGAENVAYNWIERTDDNTHTGVIMYVPNSSFTFDINKAMSLDDSMKIDSQVSEYRLVSPNYQGSFDFNLAFNGGSCSGFDVYCTYKPYNPFIKVAPQFALLYGTDYGDQRGLVCGGDFSISLVKSAWESYELQNKNYQNIFNREIQNMRFEQYYQRRDLYVGGAVGVFSGGITGADAGFKMSGSPYGAIAGAAVGSTASAIGYAVDIDTLAKRQREQRELAKDKFGYSLANIQALPYTLTKVSQFDAVSKIWPFLEHYTCTDEEKEALRNKITWEGMTVNRIGSLGEFLQDDLSFIKGYLIRADGISAPTNISQAIADELSKGVYIK